MSAAAEGAQQTAPVRRVGFFGGTFDPPHRGHLAIASAAADRFALDDVLFAPVARQPLKQAATAASFADRLAMVELACTEDSRFRASDLDRPRAGGDPNYTADALRQLASSGGALRLFAIAGADSFHSLGHWREPHRLLALAEWIVVSRPGIALSVDHAPEGMQLTAAERARIHPLSDVHDPVSATELRRRLQADEPCNDLLPEAVARFIAVRRLYRGSPR